MQTVATRLGDFVADLRLDQPEPEIVERAKVSLLHSLAVGLAGHELEFARIARETAVAHEWELA